MHVRRLLLAQAMLACLLVAGAARAEPTTVTFLHTNDLYEIAPIVFSNCVVCHREGEVAPFPLTNYDQVSKRAKQIAQVVSDQIMPPWKPCTMMPLAFVRLSRCDFARM